MNKGRKRPLIVNFTCSKEEYETIKALALRTTCRSFSEYARKLLMGKGVVTTVRNRSLDGLIDELNPIYNLLERLVGQPGWTMKEREELLRLLELISSTVYKIIEQCIRI
jgi:hypothetical protein